MNKPARAIIGFIVGSGLAFLLIGLVFTGLESVSGRRASPRGGGWFLLILGAGLVCSRLFVAFDTRLIHAAPVSVRIMVAGPLAWLALVLSFVWVFDPFGSYVSDDEKWLVGKIVAFPIAVAFLGYFGYRRLFGRDKKPDA